MENYSAIKEMFYGNRGNYDSIKLSIEGKNALDKVVETEESFIKMLNDKPQIIEAYKNLNARINEMNATNFEDAYIEGFRFGFLMALDILK